jgi:deazaflavin-dependent oxidoreductase (nitroreductase family)
MASSQPFDPQAASRYRQPGPITRHVFNPLVKALTRFGIPLHGTRVLRVRGRRSGELRSVVVNLLTYDGAQYLVAPRGVTQWVRNLRAAGSGELLLGRRVEPFTAEELADDDKPRLLRAYLREWKLEVGAMFPGVDTNAPDAAFREIAASYPVFRLRPDSRSTR